MAICSVSAVNSWISLHCLIVGSAYDCLCTVPGPSEVASTVSQRLLKCKSGSSSKWGLHFPAALSGQGSGSPGLTRLRCRHRRMDWAQILICGPGVNEEWGNGVPLDLHQVTKIRLFPGIVTKIDFLPYVQGQPLPMCLQQVSGLTHSPREVQASSCS